MHQSDGAFNAEAAPEHVQEFGGPVGTCITILALPIVIVMLPATRAKARLPPNCANFGSKGLPWCPAPSWLSWRLPVPAPLRAYLAACASRGPPWRPADRRRALAQMISPRTRSQKKENDDAFATIGNGAWWSQIQRASPNKTAAYFASLPEADEFGGNPKQGARPGPCPPARAAA